MTKNPSFLEGGCQNDVKNMAQLAGQSFKVSGDEQSAYNKLRSTYLTKYMKT